MEENKPQTETQTQSKTQPQTQPQTPAELSAEQRQAIEAAVFQRLVAHLQKRVDVQNIDLMNLSGFCRNCLSKWFCEAAAQSGITLDYNEVRTDIYAMPYDTWKAEYQK